MRGQAAVMAGPDVFDIELPEHAGEEEATRLSEDDREYIDVADVSPLLFRLLEEMADLPGPSQSRGSPANETQGSCLWKTD